MVAPQIHNVDIEDMAPNSGATIQKGLRKVAVYKDSEGKKHSFSALCPHLGCLLQVRTHKLMHACTSPLSKLLLLTCLLRDMRTRPVVGWHPLKCLLTRHKGKPQFEGMLIEGHFQSILACRKIFICTDNKHRQGTNSCTFPSPGGNTVHVQACT